MMKKYLGCIKMCAEDIYVYIQVVLDFILKHIRKCGKVKMGNLNCHK